MRVSSKYCHRDIKLKDSYYELSNSLLREAPTLGKYFRPVPCSLIGRTAENKWFLGLLIFVAHMHLPVH
jgi:hypothetical protein